MADKIRWCSEKPDELFRTHARKNTPRTDEMMRQFRVNSLDLESWIVASNNGCCCFVSSHFNLLVVE